MLALSILSLGMAGKRVVVPPPYGEAALLGSLKDRVVCVAPGALAWEDRQYELHVGAVVHAPTMEVPAEMATVDAAELVARRSELLGHVVRLRGTSELGTALAFQSVWGEHALTKAIVASVPGTGGRLFIASPRELGTDFTGALVATSQPESERLVVLRPLGSVVDPDQEMETFGRKPTTARRALEDAIGGPLPDDALAAHELRAREPTIAATWIPLDGSSHRRWARFTGALTALPSDTACGRAFDLSPTELRHRDGPGPRLSMESRLHTQPDVPKRLLGRSLLDALPYLLASLAAFGGFVLLPRREPLPPEDRRPGSPYRAGGPSHLVAEGLLDAHQDLCANQDGPAFARCIKCRLPFCDHCAAYMVNGKPWCEPCGRAAIEEARFPRWRIALAVVVFAFFGVFGVSAADSGHMRGFVGCMAFAVVLPLLILNPIGVADRPHIERRRPSTSLSR